MAKTYVYIDGFNLYYGCLKRTPYKWLNLAALAQALLPNDHVETIKYFTARVSARPQNPSAPIDQQVYLRALRTIPNMEIVFGHFLTHSVPMMLSGVMPPQRVWVDKTEEKGSDVNLAAHLVRDAFQKRFEVAVLVTNDSDLAEPVRIVTKELGMPVGILNPHEHHGEARWTAWINVLPRLVSDMLTLLGTGRALYISLQERRQGRVRWVKSLSLQTTDPAEE